LDSFAVNDSWDGQAGIPLGDYNQVAWTGEHIEGAPFKVAYLNIPANLAPGESVTLHAVLAPRSEPYPGCWSCGFWILPHADWDVKNLAEGYPDPDDWAFLYRGSTTTFTARMTCSSPTSGAAFPNLNDIFKNKLDVNFPK
jgi:hypothetical protein